MQIPLQITIRGLPHCDTLELRIRERPQHAGGAATKDMAQPFRDRQRALAGSPTCAIAIV